MAGGGDEKLTVSFVDGDSELSNVDIDKNSYVTEPAAPTKEGYIFAGWYSDSACTKEFDFKNTKITENTKIYAKFVANDEKFTVSFNTNGGSSIASQTVNAGEKVTKPADPTKANNKFAGWYCDSALTQPYDFSSQVLSSFTLYAKWTAESGTYTVTFNSNGGSAVPAQTVKAGEKAVKPANPTKSGYSFSGWYSDASLTTQYDFNSAVNADITLCAKWTSNGGGGGGGPVTPTTYTVTFDVNKDGASVTPDLIRVEANSCISILPTPKLNDSGYAFLGWNTASDGSGNAFTETTKVNGNKTVYAQWSKTKVVTEDTTDSSNPVAKVTITDEIATELVNTNSNKITINADVSTEGTTLPIQISKDDLSKLNTAINESSTVNSLEFETKDGSVTLDSTTISKLVESEAENITIKVEKVADTTTAAKIGDNPLIDVSILKGTKEIELPAGSEITVKINAKALGINDLNNCKIFYVDNSGVIRESFDFDVLGDTIIFSTPHNSYYAIVGSDGLLDYTIKTANNWLTEAGLNGLFKFKQDTAHPSNVSLIINADKVFGDKNALQGVNTSAFNGFLTNFGKFVDVVFDDSTLTLSIDDFTDRAVLSNGSLNDDATVQFVYDLLDDAFSIISKMTATNDQYLFKTIDGTLNDVNFNVNIYFVDSSKNPATESSKSLGADAQEETTTEKRDYINEIQNFAAKIDDHLKMNHVGSQLIIKFESPDALLDYAYNIFKNGGTDSFSSLDANGKEAFIEAFDQMTVGVILDKMDDATLEQVFGSQQYAVKRVLAILLNNEVFINKVLSEVDSVTVTDNTGKTHNLLESPFNFNPDTTEGLDNWQKMIKTLTAMLDGGAKSLKPGDFKQGDETIYSVPVKITLDMHDELGTETTELNILVKLNIFPEVGEPQTTE